MAAKFLDDSKPKNVTSKVNSHCFRVHRSYSVAINCQMLTKFSGVKSESLVKEKELCCVQLLYKVGT